MSKLSHLDDAGRSSMVDVSAKSANLRTATAEAIVRVGAEINAVLEEQSEEDAPLGHASSEEKVGAVTAAGKRCTT